VRNRVGVLAPESSWHFQDLKRASESFNGKIQIRSLDYASLAASVETGDQERFSEQRGAIDELDALIVRAMPRGSLQQIIFRMDVLHRIAESGVQVFNPPRSLEIAIDKYLSLSLMASEGIPVPRFAVCQTAKQGMEAFQQLGGDVVLKPIFGSMGKNLHRLTEATHAQENMEMFVAKGEVLYLQQFIEHGGSDVRILVVGNETFSMKRVNPKGGWLTNIARGGVAEPYTPTEKELNLARHAAKANSCKIAGVDIVYEKNCTEPKVLEVNASPGWEAVQKVCECDVANSVLKLVTTSLG